MILQRRPLLLRPLPLILFLTALQLIVALPSDHFSFDEAMWQYIGRNWFRNGMAPYAGGVDNKPPFIFAVFGLSDKLFGVNCWFPRLAGAIFQSLGIYYVYKIARNVASENAAVLSTTIYGLSLLWKSTDGASVSYTETYAITFIIISFYCSLTAKNSKLFFISGFIACLGFSVRFTAFFGIAAIFISSYRRNKRSVIPFCYGLLFCGILISILFLAAGINLQDFLFYSLTDNFSPGSITDHDFTWKMSAFMNGFFYSDIILFYPFVIAFIFFNKNFNFLVTWLICEFIGICVIGTFATTHFKDLLPALSLMTGMALAILVERYTVPLRLVLLIVWIAFFPKLLNPIIDLKHLIRPAADNSDILCSSPNLQADENSKKKLGLWIKSNTNAGDQVFVAGYGAIIQAYSERESPTIYFNVTRTPAAKKRLFSDVGKKLPAVIAIPISEQHNNNNDDIKIFIDSLLRKDYSLMTCRYGYGIYRIKKE